MNHDHLHKAARLYGLALQLERGELDKEFAASDVPLVVRKELIAARVRRLADLLQAAGSE